MADATKSQPVGAIGGAVNPAEAVETHPLRVTAEAADAFAAQADWHERKGHPLAEIIAAPGGTSWRASPDSP